MGEMSMRPPRRVVTGHDSAGRAIISIDDRCPTVGTSEAEPDLRSYEVWETNGIPVLLGNEPDPTDHPYRIEPKSGGCVVRIADIPPDRTEMMDPKKIEMFFKNLGSPHASTSAGKAQPHPLMHRTETLDYGIVIEGKITLILDDSEVTLEPGDVVVQRGTNHAWSNRTDRIARVAFVLMDGAFSPEILDQSNASSGAAAGR
jgi:mannose-6-phosphate isomerase-like protein (cupin superfamily)